MQAIHVRLYRTWFLAVGEAAATAVAGLAEPRVLVVRFIVYVYCQRVTAVTTLVCDNSSRYKSARTSGAAAKRSYLSPLAK